MLPQREDRAESDAEASSESLQGRDIRAVLTLLEGTEDLGIEAAAIRQLVEIHAESLPQYTKMCTELGLGRAG